MKIFVYIQDEGKLEGCTYACIYVWKHTYLAFPTEALDGCLRNFVRMKSSWFAHVLLSVGQICPGAYLLRAKICQRCDPYSKNYFLRPKLYSNKLNVQQSWKLYSFKTGYLFWTELFADRFQVSDIYPLDYLVGIETLIVKLDILFKTLTRDRVITTQ